MSQQFLRRSNESNRVRQLRVQLECSLIRPLRMNREHKGLPNRLKYVNTHTTSLSSSRLDDPQQFLPELHLLARPRFKPDENVKGQAAPPERQYVESLISINATLEGAASLLPPAFTPNSHEL